MQQKCLFKILYLSPFCESTNKFRNILKHDTFRSYVREVYLRNRVHKEHVSELLIL